MILFGNPIFITRSLKRDKKMHASQENSLENTNSKQEKMDLSDEVDEEGLKVSGYDVIICGTSLVHSILASALSLAGKSVLHCDGGDYYGEADASMDLRGILEWAKENSSLQQCSQKENNETKMNGTSEEGNLKLMLDKKGSWAGLCIHSYSSTESNDSSSSSSENKVQTPYGKGTVITSQSSSNSDSSTAISLDSWTLADGHSHPILYTHDPSLQPKDYVKDSLSQSRRFILDFTTQGPLLLANDRAVSGLISSNVADYIEFKSVQSLHILLPANGKTHSRSTSAANNKTSEDSESLSLHQVPCSKGDVFQTSLLTPLEKRKLMKFLQLISDYGISKQQNEHKYQQPNDQSEENQVIQSQNERSLNQGRSLSRPQNKSVPTGSLQQLKSILLQDENENESPLLFHKYLQETLKFSPRLSSLVIYSLAMQTTSIHSKRSCTVKQGITSLLKHLNSLGRFGKTAFLTPLYGAGEISQSFCRSSAVHGGVYLLRRCPRQIIKGTNSSLEVNIMGDPLIDMEQKEKTVKGKHVIASQAALQNSLFDVTTSSVSKPKSRTLKRISVIHGIFPDLEKEELSISMQEVGQSQIIIIPPMTSNIENVHVIQGLILDHTSNVTPLNYAVIHLSTILDVNDDKDMDCKVLDRAMTSILSFINSKLKKGTDALKEIHHVCFSVLNDFSTDLDEKFRTTLRSKNIYISNLSPQSLTVEDAFEEAERIFSMVCHNDKTHDGEVKFLEICSALRKIRDENKIGGVGDIDDDHDKVVLESAFNMIDLESKKDDGAIVTNAASINTETKHSAKHPEEKDH